MRFLLRASTKVSCVGFVIWCPSGGLPRRFAPRNDINIPAIKRRDIILSLKRREFDGFLGFFAGSENPSVLSVHEFSGSVKTPKRRELSPFCLVVLVLKKIQHLPAPADKQRIAVKQRLVRGEVYDDVIVALDRKNVDVVFFADIKRHKGASCPT